MVDRYREYDYDAYDTPNPKVHRLVRQPLSKVRRKTMNLLETISGGASVEDEAAAVRARDAELALTCRSCKIIFADTKGLDAHYNLFPEHTSTARTRQTSGDRPHLMVPTRSSPAVITKSERLSLIDHTSLESSTSPHTSSSIDPGPAPADPWAHFEPLPPRSNFGMARNDPFPRYHSDSSDDESGGNPSRLLKSAAPFTPAFDFSGRANRVRSSSAAAATAEPAQPSRAMLAGIEARKRHLARLQKRESALAAAKEARDAEEKVRNAMSADQETKSAYLKSLEKSSAPTKSPAPIAEDTDSNSDLGEDVDRRSSTSITQRSANPSEEDDKDDSHSSEIQEPASDTRKPPPPPPPLRHTRSRSNTAGPSSSLSRTSTVNVEPSTSSARRIPPPVPARQRSSIPLPTRQREASTASSTSATLASAPEENEQQPSASPTCALSQSTSLSEQVQPRTPTSPASSFGSKNPFAKLLSESKEEGPSVSEFSSNTSISTSPVVTANDVPKTSSSSSIRPVPPPPPPPVRRESRPPPPLPPLPPSLAKRSLSTPANPENSTEDDDDPIGLTLREAKDGEADRLRSRSPQQDTDGEADYGPHAPQCPHCSRSFPDAQKVLRHLDDSPCGDEERENVL